MNITLKNIVPNPLKESLSPKTELWGKEVFFEDGKYIHVSAPSGTGKSTLLGILYGTRMDFEGELTINNKKVKDWSALRSSEIAVVFQELELLGDLTALENVQLKNQLTAHLSDAEIHEMFEMLGIEDLINNRAVFLSRGEKQRVAIIRALCMPFKILLLDEPFSALDKENSAHAISLIKRVAAKNKAGIIVANLSQDNYFEYDQKIILA
jgi:ABC-type lipoprotein export system ATPase subunit